MKHLVMAAKAAALAILRARFRPIADREMGNARSIRAQTWSRSEIPSLDFVALQDRVGRRVGTERLDLRGCLNAAIRRNLLKHFQARFDALNVSTILCGAFSCFLGYQPTHFLFVLEPLPEPSVNDCKGRNYENEGEDVSHAVSHIDLLACTIHQNLARRTVLFVRHSGKTSPVYQTCVGDAIRQCGNGGASPT